MTRKRRVDSNSALVRAGIAMGAGLVAWAVATTALSGLAAVLVGWDVGGLVLIAISWLGILSADAHFTKDRAGSEDPGRTMVYVVVVVTSAVSLLAATALLPSARSLPPTLSHWVTAMSLAAVSLSWLLTHTAFTFRYARLYYRADAEGVGGITFAGERPPAYFDFAYFAFTIGMCFQVSDVTITSPQIRRTVLLHAVMSFVYNSAILAFVLNLVFLRAS